MHADGSRAAAAAAFAHALDARCVLTHRAPPTLASNVPSLEELVALHASARAQLLTSAEPHPPAACTRGVGIAATHGLPAAALASVTISEVNELGAQRSKLAGMDDDAAARIGTEALGCVNEALAKLDRAAAPLEYARVVLARAELLLRMPPPPAADAKRKAPSAGDGAVECASGARHVLEVITPLCPGALVTAPLADQPAPGATRGGGESAIDVATLKVSHRQPSLHVPLQHTHLLSCSLYGVRCISSRRPSRHAACR